MKASRFLSYVGLFTPLLVGFAAAQAPGDAVRGRALFQQSCALCHAAGPGFPGGQGPSLIGVLGRKAGSVPGATYTDGLKNSGIAWDGGALDKFLADPTASVPGTTMVVKIDSAEDRRNIIAFLSSLRAGPPGQGRRGGPPVDPNATDPNDWRHQSPGTTHKISANDLVAPYSTPAPGNFPMVVPQPADAKLAVPAGFKVEVFAKGLEGGRITQVAPNGDIFIAETRSNRIRVLRSAEGGTSPELDEIFATGLDRPFGIAFYPGGAEPEWVYVANNNSVVRFPYRSGDLKARGNSETIVPKLSDTTNGHTTRDLAFSKDGQRLFISVGSGSNLGEGMPAKTPDELKEWEANNAVGAAWGAETHRANILVTSPDGKAPLKIFAAGIRNPVGLGIEPVTGDLWTSTNERDGLGDDLVPDSVTSVKEGGYYGWPWYYLGDHQDPRLKDARPDLANKAIVPDVLLQAHSAALGIAFYNAVSGSSVFPPAYRGDLFVALHGSWNRNSRTGYKVVRVKLEKGKPTGEYEDFLTGFVADARGVWGRPVGVAVARDGSLLVTEDGNGTIWRVSTTH